jgi:predicted MFS family arabinose efflux permease
MALIAFIHLRAPGSTLEIAKILSFTIIPVFLIGPLAGVYVDRWDRRKTMYICDLLRAGLVLLIPLFLFNSKSMLPIYFIIFIMFCIGRFFVPAKLSIIPDLVKSQDLLIANSLVNVTGMLAAILGFGLSGVLVEWLGVKSGFYLDSVSFLISAVMIFSISGRFFGYAKSAVSSETAHKGMNIKAVGREIIDVINKSVFQEVKEGILYFIKNKDIRFTAVISFILWSALGAVYTVIIAFVQQELKSATKDLGLLVMFLGVGLFLGSIVYGRFGHRLSHYKIIFASMISNGIMLIIFSVGIVRYPYFSAAAVLALSLGFLISPIIIASNTIIHNAGLNGMLGKIFSSLEIVMHLGFLIFMFISSMFAERFPPAWILIIVGCIISVLGVINLICYRKISWLN